MRFFIKTLGCRTNISESESLMTALSNLGYVYSAEDPELIVINSCTVTASADRKTRQAITSLKHKFPAAKIVLTGCGARNNELDWKVESYATWQDLLKTVEAVQIKEEFELPLRTRAHVKIQEGCNNHCSYCIISKVRGPERSVALDEILQEIQSFEKRGGQEIVLTGTHIANWGREFDKNLHFLVKAILSESSIPLLRLSSLEPQHFSDSFLQIFKEERVCPYIHIALQSASDNILKVMKRRYSTDDVRNMIKKLRKLDPDMFIAADVIVGFPGETEQDFWDTYEFCEGMRLSGLHVFTYSSRPGTDAAKLADQVPTALAKQRSEKLRELSTGLLGNYAKRFISKELDVLVEGLQDHYWKGTSSNFLKVKFKDDAENLRTSLVRCKIISWNEAEQCLEGHRIDKELRES